MDPAAVTSLIQFSIRALWALAAIIVGIVCFYKYKKRGSKVEENRSSIIIKDLYCGHMKIAGTPLGAFEAMETGVDYVGGVDIRVAFKNNTNKIINYVSFVFNVYNTVGDMVMCNIKMSYESAGLFTGPLLPGNTSSSLYFRGMFYNASIVGVKIKSALITYADDTTEELTEFR